MKTSGWIPLDKNLVKALPKDRSFTELEAMFSVSVDFDNQNEVTLTGYAKRWRWNHKTVKRYFKKWGVKIVYSSSTKSMQNQRGMINGMIRERSGNDKGMIRFIDISYLKKKRERSGNDKGMIRERSGDTTLNPNPNPNPNPKTPPLTPPTAGSKMELTEFSCELRAAFQDCKKILQLSDIQITRLWEEHSDETRFIETTQVCVEKSEQETLRSPTGFFHRVYESGALSFKTRNQNGKKVDGKLSSERAALYAEDEKRYADEWAKMDAASKTRSSNIAKSQA
jgi:hypothetical protein